eukprot:jgi/Mesvir1/19253/Mv25203-RA.1
MHLGTTTWLTNSQGANHRNVNEQRCMPDASLKVQNHDVDRWLGELKAAPSRMRGSASSDQMFDRVPGGKRTGPWRAPPLGEHCASTSTNSDSAGHAPMHDR